MLAPANGKAHGRFLLFRRTGKLPIAQNAEYKRSITRRSLSRDPHNTWSPLSEFLHVIKKLRIETEHQAMATIACMVW